jgi:hypothetical protein
MFASLPDCTPSRVASTFRNAIRQNQLLERDTKLSVLLHVARRPGLANRIFKPASLRYHQVAFTI